MFYIHKAECLSPQPSLEDFDNVNHFNKNKLYVTEPKYSGIPSSTLRRMGKAVRLGMGVAMPFLNEEEHFDGIIIGTANGGMEDCIKFLNQIMEYDEDTLTPTNFVQSTTNAIAAQLAFFFKNKGYNATHVHRGLAFEMALLDVQMLLNENPQNKYLIGGVEEISTYNFNIDFLAKWFREIEIDNFDLYNDKFEGTIAGEGASMYSVSLNSNDSLAKCVATDTLHTEDISEVQSFFESFIKRNNLNIDSIDVLISGENGDTRFEDFYNLIESNLRDETIISRFKHLIGEFQTATSIALFLGIQIIKNNKVPDLTIKKNGESGNINNILIYNNYQGLQHSLIYIQKTK